MGDSHPSRPAPLPAQLSCVPAHMLLAPLSPDQSSSSSCCTHSTAGHSPALSSPRDEQLPRNSYKTHRDSLHPHIQHLGTTSGQAAILMASGAQRTWARSQDPEGRAPTVEGWFPLPTTVVGLCRAAHCACTKCPLACHCWGSHCSGHRHEHCRDEGWLQAASTVSQPRTRNVLL